MAFRRLQFRELITCSFLLTALLLGSAFAQPSAVDQGKTLKSLAADWGVRFPAWEIDPDPCASNWTYVTCDKATSSRVTKLSMPSVNLTGPIPKTIGELVYLEHLDLTNNSLVDPIPVEIGNLVRLQQLILNRNLFQSPPPDALLRCNLTRLQMNRNKISGQLPVWISQITTLSYLDFNSNEMWGGLPPEYGNLVGLTSVQLWENGFSGYMPDSWRNLVNVKNYGMGHLYMTGPIPEWIFELPKLQTVNFMRNQFIGPFPNLTKHLHNGIANFTSWDFHCNYLQGDYPVGYYNVLPIPNTTLNYTNNCFSNETDGSATINNSPNATQNTPLACGRTYNCPDFYAAMKANGNCAPCPPSQFITNHTNCVCGKELPSSKSETPVGAIVGGVIGGIVATLAVSALLFFLYLKKGRVKYPHFGRKREGLDDPWTVPKELNRFTLQELEKATDKFSEEFFIGEGGFGKVYRGVLMDGKIVAIKCASIESAQGQGEFRNELALLSRLHHRHLVGLEGFCDEDGLQILVYEFMSNGDLHDNLLGKNRSTMNATQRLEVAVGIARGLDYLHSSANPPVIHRDVKPSNVLLDDFMVAKLADFGISKISPELYTHVSTRPLGTMGYMDPDYFRTNRLTVASDVYAFGVVLLELVTGQRVFDTSRMDGINLNDWVRPRFADGGVRDIVDERLGDEYDADLFTILTEIGLSCSKSDRSERPSMKEVLNILEPHAAKAMKESVADPKWSTSHFKNKSLFEENGRLTPRSNDSSASNTLLMPTPSSGTSSGTNTVTFDAFTALQPR
jgi:serine/threonine protein kinase